MKKEVIEQKAEKAVWIFLVFSFGFIIGRIIEAIAVGNLF